MVSQPTIPSGRRTSTSDLHFCQLGVLRCMSSAATGREFLQYDADRNVADIDSGHFFRTPDSSGDSDCKTD